MTNPIANSPSPDPSNLPRDMNESAGKNESFSKNEPTSEWEWTAFLYVAGELNTQQINAFEARLSSDQVVREAVADAVQMAQWVRAALHDPPKPDDLMAQQSPTAGPFVEHRSAKISWWRRIAWISVGAAATALFLMLNGNIRQPEWRISTNRTHRSIPVLDVELAVSWVESQFAIRDEPFGDFQASDDPSAAWSETEAANLESGSNFETGNWEVGVDDDGSSSTLTPPMWMMTAVQGVEAMGPRQPAVETVPLSNRS